ncbi:MAG: cadherin-like domain-containing protein, partial [Clostridia bacterium]|nr:cadherin-like domain-containing protein [Clostridia bacterium]
MSNFRAQFKITIISAVLFHLLLVLAVGIIPARALNENVEMKDFAKNAIPGASIIFTEDDVEENTLSKLRPSGFLVSGMPGSDVGSLSLDGKKLSEGSIIPSDEIEKLVFTPATSAEFSAELCLVPLVSLASFDRGSAPITVSLNFSGDLNSPPVAGNYSFETYENMPIYVSLSAFDHDGDRLSYKVVSASGKGTLHIDDANRLVFTPEKDTTGKFELSYYARDSFGNTSAPGQIKIDVNQQKNSMEIADISDPCHSFASVRLAEEGIYSGEQYGSLTVLSPSEGFTRTEFAAVCACALGYNPEVSVFLDTRGVSQWE